MPKTNHERKITLCFRGFLFPPYFPRNGSNVSCLNDAFCSNTGAVFCKVISILISASLAWPGCIWPITYSSRDTECTRAFTLAAPSEASKETSGGAIIAVGKVLADVVTNMDPNAPIKSRSEEFSTNLIARLTSIKATDLEGTSESFAFMVANGKSSVRVVIDPRNMSWEHADRREGEPIRLKYALIPLVMGNEKLLFSYRDQDELPDIVWTNMRALFKTIDQVTVDEVEHLTLEVNRLRQDFVPRPLKELMESFGRSPARSQWPGPTRTLNAFLLAIGLSALAIAGPMEAQVASQRVLPASATVTASLPQRQALGTVGQFDLYKEGKVLEQSMSWMAALLAVLMEGPISEKILLAVHETAPSPTFPVPKDRSVRTHVVIDLSFLAKVTAHTDLAKKDEWSQVVSRSEEFKQLAQQVRAVANSDVAFDIITPYSEEDTKKIFALSNVDLAPWQYNKLFPDMGIAEAVDAIVEQESPKGVGREAIEKRILFLFTKPWADHYKVFEHKDKNYRILIGEETTALGKMVYSGLVLIDAILSDTPDQFIPLLRQWYVQNDLPIPSDIDLSTGANGVYNIPADIETKQGMADYLLNTAKYSEEAKIRA